MKQNTLPYDLSDSNSIIEYAKKLEGKTINEVLLERTNSQVLQDSGVSYQSNYEGKGNFGQHLEREYFMYEPNSDSGPDFPDTGIELKSTALKCIKSGNYQAKERLVLNIINFMTIVDETNFDSSTFFHKNSFLLLVFYLYNKGVSPQNLSIYLVGIWKLIDNDKIIIERDWTTIVNKIKAGKAHEISEGDTFYLGACTKGSTTEKSMRKQPYSKTRARQRAFSFKQSYLNHIIAVIGKRRGYTLGKLIPELTQATPTIEEIVYEKFQPYIANKTAISKIIKDFNLTISPKAKNKFAKVTKSVLGFNPDQKIEEFVKSGITIRTIRLNKNKLPRESISFPAFKYTEIVEDEWIDSDIYNQIANKFLFIFLEEIPNTSDYCFNRVVFWSMPSTDIDITEEMYYKLQKIILEGDIINKMNKNGNRVTNFQKLKTNITNIRPHGRDSQDTYPLPVPLKYNNEKEYTKHCIWLNPKYVRDKIYKESEL